MKKGDPESSSCDAEGGGRAHAAMEEGARRAHLLTHARCAAGKRAGGGGREEHKSLEQEGVNLCQVPPSQPAGCRTCCCCTCCLLAWLPGAGNSNPTRVRAEIASAGSGRDCAGFNLGAPERDPACSRQVTAPRWGAGMRPQVRAQTSPSRGPAGGRCPPRCGRPVFPHIGAAGLPDPARPPRSGPPARVTGKPPARWPHTGP